MKSDKKQIGEVIELLPNANFRVKIENKEYQCYTSGRMRMNKIRVMIGDRVEVVLDEVGHLGRVTRRL